MQEILIVDDSNLSRRILRRILETDGYRVSEAADGFSALEQYSLAKPDLVVLDLTMEEMHGLDLLSKLLQLDPQVRAIVATADIQAITRQLTKDAGAAAFIAKPFAETTVLETVKRVLERP
jgi:two-component system, chemotaxis family, chemotaxis protein CheY